MRNSLILLIFTLSCSIKSFAKSNFTSREDFLRELYYSTDDCLWYKDLAYHLQAGFVIGASLGIISIPVDAAVKSYYDNKLPNKLNNFFSTWDERLPLHPGHKLNDFLNEKNYLRNFETLSPYSKKINRSLGNGLTGGIMGGSLGFGLFLLKRALGKCRLPPVAFE